MEYKQIDNVLIETHSTWRDHYHVGAIYGCRIRSPRQSQTPHTHNKNAMVNLISAKSPEQETAIVVIQASLMTSVHMILSKI